VSLGGRTLIWLRAVRAPFFTASAMSVIVGSAAAWAAGAPVRVVSFILALVGVVALHAGGNLANDYYDHLSGNDEANVHFGPFSGGSRMIQNGLVPASHVLRAALAAFAVSLFCAVVLWLPRGGWQIPVLGLSGLAAGFLYTAPSSKLAYRGAGELVVGAAFGPLATMGAYYIQAGGITAGSFWCGVPVGLLVALILLLNEFPDVDADRLAGKRTLIVRLGLTRGVALCAILYATAYAVTAATVAAGLAPRGTYWVFATIPMPAFAIAHLWRHRFSPPNLAASSAVGILTHLVYSAILAAAYLLAA
jgi:1,4-dihydroxy-2-naphthoate octaprenyltransferase